MSTSRRVHLLFSALALAAAGCSRREVSYAGLDEPSGLLPIHIGLVVDATGPDGDRGRALADAFRGEIERAPRIHGREIHATVYDDRGREDALRTAAERLEAGRIHFAVTGPTDAHGDALAQLAPRSIVICAGCGPAGAPREASFALAQAAAGPAEQGAAVARWILAALRRGEAFWPREIVAALRATQPPTGAALAEGSAPALDPRVFRPDASRSPR